jgi:hypothetical protein
VVIEEWVPKGIDRTEYGARDPSLVSENYLGYETDLDYSLLDDRYSWLNSLLDIINDMLLNWGD